MPTSFLFAKSSFRMASWSIGKARAYGSPSCPNSMGNTVARISGILTANWFSPLVSTKSRVLSNRPSAIRNGIVGVFAGGTFDPNERIRFRNGEVLSLSQYAARCNIQLIRTADLNEKLRQRGCEASTTVQRICRVCQDEEEVRDVPDGMWLSPHDAVALLNEVALRNQTIFDLEQKLAMSTVATGQVRNARAACGIASPKC
jgi:hypothetical protein